MDKKIEQELSYKEWEKQKNLLVTFLKAKATRLFETRDSFNIFLKAKPKKNASTL